MTPRLPLVALRRLSDAHGAAGGPKFEAEVLQVLARIARTGKASDRLRAAELIGRQLGMFRDKPPGGEATFAELVLRAQRRREANRDAVPRRGELLQRATHAKVEQ